MDFKTLVFSPLNHLTWLIAQENFIILSRQIAQENFIILSHQESNKSNLKYKFEVKGYVSVLLV